MHNTDYIFDAIVIGSGPSGTVCAENLVKKKNESFDDRLWIEAK
tara:strand:+ start:516 stop:647 length:132 start_codon:yes stop_codon:yes gene_type:complete